jgi:hypothetical protein
MQRWVRDDPIIEAREAGYRGIGGKIGPSELLVRRNDRVEADIARRGVSGGVVKIHDISVRRRCTYRNQCCRGENTHDDATSQWPCHTCLPCKRPSRAPLLLTTSLRQPYSL